MRTSVFNFQVRILGGSALSMTGANTELKMHAIKGDKTGRVTARQGQKYNLVQPDRVLLPHALLTQRQSQTVLPPKLDCSKLDILIRGKYCKILY